MSTPSPLARALAEIRQLHAFFEDWFTGRVEVSEAELERVAEVLDPSFYLITPMGMRMGRTRLLRLLAESHGRRPPDFRITVEEAEGRLIGDDLVLTQYDECHAGDGVPTRRVSTALFRLAKNTPNSVVWLCVHETWRDVSDRSNDVAPGE